MGSGWNKYAYRAYEELSSEENSEAQAEYDDFTDSRDNYFWGEKDDFTDIQIESSEAIFEAISNNTQSPDSNAASTIVSA